MPGSARGREPDLAIDCLTHCVRIMAESLMSARTRPSATWAIALVGIAACLPVMAQSDPAPSYPSRPIRLIVPFVAGGGTDVSARLIAQKLTEAWGQPVIVDNRGGANGTIGVEMAAKAPPDGYTLTIISASHSVNVSLYRNLRYDLSRDFSPVIQLTTQPYVLVVNAGLPVTSVAGLVAMAKAKPDVLNYGSSGVGGLSHLSGALFAALVDIRLTHIPYKGGAPAMEGVISGQIEMLFSTLLQSRAQIATSTLRPLAVTTATRSPAAPEIPTMIEAGVPGFVVAGWYGVLAPKGTSSTVVAKLNSEIARILRLPDVRDRLASDGSEPVGNTPEEFAAHINSEISRWRKVIVEAELTPESDQ
jgi:tripartite-type tricarboxylate transporter receptor subunit TctC